MKQQHLIQEASDFSDLAISTTKIVFTSAIGIWLTKAIACLIAKAFGRYIRLELEQFKDQLKTEIMDEIKKEFGHDKRL